jgi:hypothetical protein
MVVGAAADLDGRLTAPAAQPPGDKVPRRAVGGQPPIDCESAKPVSQNIHSRQLHQQAPPSCSKPHELLELSHQTALRRLLGRCVSSMPLSTCPAGCHIRGFKEPTDRRCRCYWKPRRMAGGPFPARAASNPRLSSSAVSVSTTNPLLLPFRSFWTASGRADSKCHLPPCRPSGVAGHRSVKTPISSLAGPSVDPWPKKRDKRIPK